MATLTSTDTGSRYEYAPCMDRIGLDLMMYGVAFQIDGQRIDPARVMVHMPIKETEHGKADHEAA